MTGKKACLLVFFVFALPVIMAKLVLEMNWYTKGVTNQGQWLKEPLELSWLPFEGRWRLVYQLPRVCHIQCEQALFQLQQIPKAIGREQKRVASILLTSETALNDFLTDFSITSHQLNASQQANLSPLPSQNPAIYLVDPFNQVILSYFIPAGSQAQIQQSKGLMKDLRKLMKLSKVG